MFMSTAVPNQNASDLNKTDNPVTEFADSTSISTSAPQQQPSQSQQGDLNYQPQTPSAMEAYPTAPAEKPAATEVVPSPEVPTIAPEPTQSQESKEDQQDSVATIAQPSEAPKVVDLRGVDNSEHRVADDATKLTKDADAKEEEFIDGVNAAHGNK